MLPVYMQLYILTFLSPQDLCNLGMTNRYWQSMVQDRLMWKYFLLRDHPTWSSIDGHSLPNLDDLNSCLCESPDGKECNYMSIYLRSSPKTRRSMRTKNPIYGAVTSFLQSLVMQGEPRFAMFGPGLEQLDDSLVTRMMTSPDLLPVVSILQRQINGVGSGVTFQLNGEHKFNILTLYSTTRSERDRARTEQSAAVNKMFVSGRSVNGEPAAAYSLIPQVKEVCKVVDGFIYVANAESQKSILNQHDYHSILQRHAIPSGLRLVGPSFIFQQDNDPKHTSRLCKGYLTKKESDGVLRQMTWSPQSPDLNPIEMVWGELDAE
ncbi:unnamed protein product [Ranitomeya imitator]|uniref:F-box domain-containing protein n=1 Tax=Ranitomeya imitator TaxID=111125 RepID=A0ABN9LE55_9NEOB|nr:unnamed protein product [Ranitomeya imitator]